LRQDVKGNTNTFSSILINIFDSDLVTEMVVEIKGALQLIIWRAF
jgi:hypothetical protein